MRFRLAAGQESSRYRPGQFVSASYAARYTHKVAEVVPVMPPFEEEYEEPYEYDAEWELTAYYEG